MNKVHDFWCYEIVNRWYRFVCWLGQWIPMPQWVWDYIENNYYTDSF